MTKRSPIPGVLLRLAAFLALVGFVLASLLLAHPPGAHSLKRARLPQATPTIA